MTTETGLTPVTLAKGAALVAYPEDDVDHDQGAPDSPPGAPSGPVPFLTGKFALFRTPDGGIVLAYRLPDADSDQQLLIPPFIVSMAGQASGLSPDAILAKIQSGRIDG